MWTTGEVTNTIYPTHALTYTVTATDVNGNTSSGEIVIRDSRDIKQFHFNMCPGSSSQIFPTLNFGYWSSNNPQIATISNAGMITYISPGTTTFSFHYNQSTCVAESGESYMLPSPIISASKDKVCQGEAIQLSPSTGGTWTSSNSAVASVSNNGTATAITPGIAQFSFTSSETGCSNTLNNILIHPTPEVEITGEDTICIAQTTTLKPNTGGIWAASNHPVGTITNAGLATGIGPGACTFTFTQTQTGCTSKPSKPVYVLQAKITTDIPRILCLGGDKQQIITEKSGTWVSSNVTVATMNNNGELTLFGPGNVHFIHDSPSYVCPSEPVEFKIQPVRTAVSSTKIFQNSFIDLKADAAGTWTSLNPNILKISGNTKAISYNQGKTSLEFISDSGCYASFAIEVKPKKPGVSTEIGLGGLKSDDFNGFSYQNTDTRLYDNNSGEIVIYPNPVSEKLNISSGNYQILRIHHISGKIMCEVDRYEREIHIQHWPAGVYNAIFYNGEEIITKLFVKI
ncbi:MAG: T9SS type A sorting domain-containing protein [Saprospiraceae bacterium]|nr:T9SS type A sorting domain-containing protein [Saprospiraceae bacterium]